MSSDGLSPEEFEGEGPVDSAGPAEPSLEEQPEVVNEAVIAELEKAKEDLARARAELYNLNQEYGKYVRRAKADAAVQRRMGQEQVAEALLGVLDDIHAAREAGELEEGPFASVSTKLEETLGTRFGLERYGTQGEDFDPQVHEALMAQTNPEVDHPLVSQVLQPGYLLNETVLRPAKVSVDNPE